VAAPVLATSGARPPADIGSPAVADADTGTTSLPGGGLGVLLAGGLALLAARPLSDNSFLTHLATGRVLLESGLPATNPFLVGGGDFPVPSWWWSGLLAVTEEAAGGPGLRLVGVVLAAVLGLLVVRLSDPVGPTAARRGLLAICVPSLLGVLSLLPFLHPRPHLGGFVLLAVTLVVWWERRSPWWLVPVFATWANVHGTWLHGLLVLVVLVVAASVDRDAGRRRLLAPVAALAGVAVGGLLYPEPLRLVLLPTEQFGSQEARDVLAAYAEWRPPSPGNPLSWVLGAVAAVAVIGALRNRRWGMAAGGLVLAALGFTALRLVPVAVISLLPLAAVALADVGTLPRPTRRAALVLSGTGVAIAAVAVVWALSGPSYSWRGYPVAAVDWLDERGLVSNPEVVVVTPDRTGNYLSWRYGTAAHAWVDDRPGVRRGSEYLDLRRGRPGWQDTLAASGVSVVLWESDDDLTAALRSDPGWVEAVEVEGFTVLCRAELSARCSDVPPNGR
jgi:hypothetical protein